MITLRLFKASDPFREIESRPMPGGMVTIGREPGNDWVIASDPGLSRRHCSLVAGHGRIWLVDTSSNGVQIGADRRPAPRGDRVEIEPGETLRLGDHVILVDPEPTDAPAPRSLQPTPARERPLTDAALLEAFCTGASLEPSAFAAEDPIAVMTRLGLLYRQVVEDLSALMRERGALKSAYRMDRTTISAADNNPLKWTSVHSVAVDLLRETNGGFLTGAEAISASFIDLNRHGACLMAASQGAVAAVLAETQPDKFEESAKRQTLAFMARSDTAWKLFQKRHAELTADMTAGNTGVVERSFREGYERKAAELEGGEEAA